MQCESPDDYVKALYVLATNETERMATVINARERIEIISDPSRITRQWRELFCSISP
jgi:hypothetical protein